MLIYIIPICIFHIILGIIEHIKIEKKYKTYKNMNKVQKWLKNRKSED